MAANRKENGRARGRTVPTGDPPGDGAKSDLQVKTEMVIRLWSWTF